MAPITVQRETTAFHFSNKEKNRLRKPIVEKMRRDRINTSIEQLKALLQRHLKQQPQQQPQPNAKLEKADILEMTVRFLKEQSEPCASAGYQQGFSGCLQETLRYLSLHAPQQAAERKALECFYGLQKRASRTRRPDGQLPTPTRTPISAKQVAPSPRTTLWRPW
ncbi:transcription factor HES-5-like [Lepisosteus oculatus]|uniref:transcription factor HES-5-like n=1 Tax=Lepisosteus oculatus TaxID=7918 RepID=UPI003720195A